MSNIYTGQATNLTDAALNDNILNTYDKLISLLEEQTRRRRENGTISQYYPTDNYVFEDLFNLYSAYDPTDRLEYIEYIINGFSHHLIKALGEAKSRDELENYNEILVKAHNALSQIKTILYNYIYNINNKVEADAPVENNEMDLLKLDIRALNSRINEFEKEVHEEFKYFNNDIEYIYKELDKHFDN